MQGRLLLAGAALAGALAWGCGNGDNAVTDAGADVDAGPPKAAITDTSVDFGAADCGGAAAAAKTVTIQNTGASPLTWSAKLDSTDAFEIAGISGGAIAPGGSAQITINAKPIPSSAAAGQQYLTTLAITTSDPALSSTSLPVSISAQGATLVLVPNVADFGVYTVQQQAPDIPLTLMNTGNKDATVSLDAPMDSQFTMEWTGSPTAATVPAGGAPMAGLKARFKATNVQAASSFSTIHVTGAGVCGASATKVDVKGQGTNGALVYSPGTLDFGLTDCGAAATSQAFTVANTGNAPLKWAAAFSSGAPYKLSVYGGVLLAQTQQIVTVVPDAIPIPSDVTNNLYGAAITLTTDAVGDSPHTVTLEQTAHGVILTATATIDYTVNGKPGDTKTLTVNNVGNASASVFFSPYGPCSKPPFCPTPPPGGLPVIVTPATSPITIAGGANQSFVLTAEPNTLGPMSASLFLNNVQGGVLCKPLPDPTNITGTMSTTATAIDVRFNDACAITPGNRAFCWGSASNYLGFGTALASTRNFGFTNLSATATDSSGYNGLCAVDATSGGVSCRSQFYNSQPAAIVNLTSGVTQLAASGGYACALASGAVYCWKVGASTSAMQVVPTGATSIAMGAFPSPGTVGVVMNNGSLWTGPATGPLTQQTAFSNVVTVTISVGYGMGGHLCALDGTGAVWCAGYNMSGEVTGSPYNPFQVNLTAPVQVNDTDNVTPLTGALGVAAGGQHTCVIRKDNTVVCLGYNADGELGIGNTNPQTGVVQAGTLNDAKSIQAGWGHTCVLRTTNDVSCWGQNFSAQSAGTSTLPSTVTTPTVLPYL